MRHNPTVTNPDRLSGLDASFLHFEEGGAHMHVGSVLLFEGEAPPYEEFVAQLERRLALVPRYRQKLAFPPLVQSRPVWVDDPHFNAGYHVRHTSLPEPGSEQQLRTLAARIFSQQLDRSKPLWEIWLIEGLKGGRFAIVGKKDLYPNQLSGGQQQLVAVARAVIASPKVILADEPTGNLHSSQGREIMELFRKLNDAGTTIIQVTHSETNAEYGSRVIELKDGWLVGAPTT